MGIYDRDYYRDSTRGWWRNWSGRNGTIWLIAITVAIFFAQLLTGGVTGEVTRAGVFSYPAIMKGELWRIITAHFLHGGYWHIIVNMFVLYWVGTELETIYGTFEFVAFYLASAIVISLAKLAIGMMGVAGEHVPGLGASGVVMAAFLVFACHYPHRQILLFFVLPVPVWLAAIGMVAYDFLGFIGRGEPGIGYSAHLLGAAFGFAYYYYDLRISRWLPRLSGVFGGRAPRLRVYEEPVRDEAVVAASTGPTSRTAGGSERSVDEQLEAKLDYVLEKVSRYGRESLTAEEQGILQRASEIYKRRRGV